MGQFKYQEIAKVRIITSNGTLSWNILFDVKYEFVFGAYFFSFDRRS